jgi:hypothetical protein
MGQIFLIRPWRYASSKLMGPERDAATNTKKMMGFSEQTRQPIGPPFPKIRVATTQRYHALRWDRFFW